MQWHLGFAGGARTACASRFSISFEMWPNCPFVSEHIWAYMLFSNLGCRPFYSKYPQCRIKQSCTNRVTKLICSVSPGQEAGFDAWGAAARAWIHAHRQAPGAIETCRSGRGRRQRAQQGCACRGQWIWYWDGRSTRGSRSAEQGAPSKI